MNYHELLETTPDKAVGTYHVKYSRLGSIAYCLKMQFILHYQSSIPKTTSTPLLQSRKGRCPLPASHHAPMPSTHQTTYSYNPIHPQTQPNLFTGNAQKFTYSTAKTPCTRETEKRKKKSWLTVLFPHIQPPQAPLNIPQLVLVNKAKKRLQMPTNKSTKSEKLQFNPHECPHKQYTPQPALVPRLY